jgi:hypothetical protein
MIRTILGEFIGLFVDDVAFAVTILVWLLIATLAVPLLNLPNPAPALILMAGLLAILVESATRRARRP